MLTCVSPSRFAEVASLAAELDLCGLLVGDRFKHGPRSADADTRHVFTILTDQSLMRFRRVAVSNCDDGGGFLGAGFPRLTRRAGVLEDERDLQLFRISEDGGVPLTAPPGSVVKKTCRETIRKLVDATFFDVGAGAFPLHFSALSAKGDEG